MRLLVGEIMVDRGRARGGQRVLEDGSSKKKALCGVSEAISSRVCWETSCVSMVYVRENPFFHPCFQAKDLGRGRDTQTSRNIDLTYFRTPPPCIFYGCKYIMGIESWLAALQATPLPPAGSGLRPKCQFLAPTLFYRSHTASDLYSYLRATLVDDQQEEMYKPMDEEEMKA